MHATVNEARSGSADDVGSYLFQLRKDLHIGEDGYGTIRLELGAEIYYSKCT